MNKEIYERLAMDVTKFDVEDVITTSTVDPNDPMSIQKNFKPEKWEMPVGF